MVSVRRMHRRTLITQHYFFLPCFFGAWARSLAATVLSFLLDFGLPRIFPASDAGFLPVGIGHHLLWDRRLLANYQTTLKLRSSRNHLREWLSSA